MLKVQVKKMKQTSEKILNSRLVIDGKLEFHTGLHIGSGDMNILTDMPLLRDSSGEFIIPGSSFAGVCRAYLEKDISEKNETKELLNKIFGYIDGDKSEFSKIKFNDMYPSEENKNHPSDIRDHVGIDRDTGSAVNRVKFDEEVYSPGSSFNFSMDVEIFDDLEKETLIISHTLLEALNNGEIKFGGKTTRGLGSCKLKNCHIKNYELNTKSGMKSWLLRNYSNETISLD